MMRRLLILSLVVAAASSILAAGRTFIVYTSPSDSRQNLYDQIAFATSLQGIVNRSGPHLLVRNPVAGRNPKRIDGHAYWFSKFRQPGEWLAAYQQREINALDDLVRTFRTNIQGVVLWDTNVPATLNIATTVAGALNAPIASPEIAAHLQTAFGIRVLVDLRGKFSGKGNIPDTSLASTGSAKCDAYLWAKVNYLDSGKCNPAVFGYLLDGSGRARGGAESLWPRDYIVGHRGFVVDLDPWDDEIPKDDPAQTQGTDRQTFIDIMQAAHRRCGSREMIEVVGYPPFPVKYSTMGGGKHHPVHTEWESVNLLSTCGAYLNAGSSANMSFHRHYQLPANLRQTAPALPALSSNVTCVALHESDYDGAAALYDRLPRLWDDPGRGSLPLAWGVNPNLIRNYPDIIEYMYRTRTPQDFIVADASGAGYVNPNFLPDLELWKQHCQQFYRQLDVSISPMVLDYDQPSDKVKQAYQSFSPGGMACIIMDLHGKGGKAPPTHLYAGMPVLKMDNLSTVKDKGAPELASALLALLNKDTASGPRFHYVRTVWSAPSMLDEARRQVEKESSRKVVFTDPYTFFELLKQSLSRASN